jgi:hypothetical protein
MSHDIALVPDNVPAHVMNAGLAREMNADAAAGISGGYPPSIRLKNGKFRLVDGAGEETILNAKDLDVDERGILNLPVVVLRAKAGLNKVWYAKAYDPAAEATAPDCSSSDGVKPDSDITEPQCATCAGCPQNAWGSGRNQNGEATKGKACSDNKILAVLYKGGVYQFKIPPASLKNFLVFVKNLSARDIPLGHAVVYAAFVEDADFQQLTFRVGQFIPEAAIPKLMGYVGSPEVEEIINPTNAPAAPAKQTAAVPERTEPTASTADLFGEGGEKTAEVEKPATTRAAGEPTMKELRAEAKALGLKGYTKLDRVELEDAIFEAKEAAGETTEKVVEPEVVTSAADTAAADTATGVPSDADIAASLGL